MTNQRRNDRSELRDEPRPSGRHFRPAPDASPAPDAASTQVAPAVSAASTDFPSPGEAAAPVSPAPDEAAAPAVPPAPDEAAAPAVPPAPAEAATFTDVDVVSYAAREEREKKRAQVRKRKRRLTIAGVIALVLVIACGGVALAINRSIEAGRQKLLEEQQDRVEKSKLGTIEFDGVTYRRKQNLATIAILGFDRMGLAVDDGKAGQADALMVLAVNTETGEMDVLAVPRDSMVAVDRYAGDAYLGQTTEQICLQFSYGDGYEKSCQYTVDALSRLLNGQPISYYFAIDMSGIQSINDAAGGVTLTALETIPRTNIVEGREVTLWGKNAYDYLHYRNTAITDSPLSRQAREEQYLKAFAGKVLSNAKGGDIGSLVNLYNTAAEFSITNLGVEEFSFLASTVVEHGVSSLDTTSFTGTYEVEGDFAALYPDERSVQQAIVDVFYEPVD